MKKTIEAIANIECPMNLIDKSYFGFIFFKISIFKMSAPINVRKIGNAVHENNSYVILNVFLNDIFNIKFVRDQLIRKFHIVFDLKCRILIKMNTLTSEKISIDLINKVMMIFTCKNLIVIIRITSKPNAKIKKIVHIKKKTTISVKTIVKISIYFKRKKLFSDRDYLFEPDFEEMTAILKKTGGFYTHVCDCNVFFVQMKNDQPVSITLARRARLGTLTEYEKKNCYEMKNSYHDATIVKSEKSFYEWIEHDSSIDF